MEIDDKILFRNEKIIFSLRKLFMDYGYKPYRMKKFEEFSMYTQLDDYISENEVITFTDTDGKIMALKPDVTLSIVRAYNDKNCDLKKLCYNENVYRIFKGTNKFRESSQIGIECLGDITDEIVSEVIFLANKSLHSISDISSLVICDIDILKSTVDALNLNDEDRSIIYDLVIQKSTNNIKDFCASKNVDNNALEKLINLCEINLSLDKAVDSLKDYGYSDDDLSRLKTVYDGLTKLGIDKDILVDFTISKDIAYYNGLVFKGFIKGIPSTVIAGGQYDNLMEKMSKNARAIGMAVYLDFIEYLEME